MKGKAPFKKRDEGSGIIGASLFGICTGLIMSLVLAIFCSFICLFSKDPSKLMSPLSTASLAAVYLTSGFIAAKKRPAAIPCGLLTGGGIAAIFWIVSLFFDDSYSSGISVPVQLLIRITFVAVSLLGALLGVNAKSKRKLRRRKR